MFGGIWQTGPRSFTVKKLVSLFLAILPNFAIPRNPLKVLGREDAGTSIAGNGYLGVLLWGLILLTFQTNRHWIVCFQPMQPAGFNLTNWSTNWTLLSLHCLGYNPGSKMRKKHLIVLKRNCEQMDSGDNMIKYFKQGWNYHYYSRLLLNHWKTEPTLKWVKNLNLYRT